MDAEKGVVAIDSAIIKGKLQTQDFRVLALDGTGLMSVVTWVQKFLGCISVFSVSTTKASTVPQSCECRINLMTGDVPSVPVEVLAAIFTGGSSSKVLIAHGSDISPIFETLVRIS